ncbi:SchA/CurD-like domain-containing protein [Amycolatopsis sp. NPDC059657]|uniref:SchA/CurD-like domain-containing protein n=1 Tax=Amycolatopsis sp. NPDC059657 TaxID=3346899 RepID=UPI0036700FD5
MSTYAAVTWQIKPGSEAQVDEIFRNFKRAASTVLRNAAGFEVGRLLGTAVFRKDTTIVRVIQFDGELADVMRHMAAQEGVQRLEHEISQYLVEERATGSAEGFASFFQRSQMQSIVQFTVPAEAAAAGRA